ncbi:MAG: stage II sporulation protein R, partial [Oscillospiraceae bacterium]|nr:stage II sporulation protein R [Oscillospiraceae bacterium]
MKSEKFRFHLRPWEIALLLALVITFCAGIWAQRTQSRLAGQLIRLHVVANSDSSDDQAEKLQLRDKVLTVLSPLLADCETQADAAAVIAENIEVIESLGDVAVSLETEYYPTREYNTFSLPAGEYLSLRVEIGQGQGQNWWCVVFPPLCTEALAEDTGDAADAFSLLSDEDESLITQDGQGYILRFRLGELWG